MNLYVKSRPKCYVYDMLFVYKYKTQLLLGLNGLYAIRPLKKVLYGLVFNKTSGHNIDMANV